MVGNDFAKKNVESTLGRNWISESWLVQLPFCCLNLPGKQESMLPSSSHARCQTFLIWLCLTSPDWYTIVHIRFNSPRSFLVLMGTSILFHASENAALRHEHCPLWYAANCVEYKRCSSIDKPLHFTISFSQVDFNAYVHHSFLFIVISRAQSMYIDVYRIEIATKSINIDQNRTIWIHLVIHVLRTCSIYLLHVEFISNPWITQYKHTVDDTNPAPPKGWLNPWIHGVLTTYPLVIRISSPSTVVPQDLSIERQLKILLDPPALPSAMVLRGTAGYEKRWSNLQFRWLMWLRMA